jgi:hypothetical protein
MRHCFTFVTKITMKTKLNRKYRRLTNGDLATFASRVHMMLTGNTNFPAPVPPLPDLNTAIDVYEATCAAYQRGNKMTALARDQQREIVFEILDQLAQYCELAANFEDNLLIGSGFDLVKQPANQPIPSIPVILGIEDGVRSGQVKIKVDVQGSVRGLTTLFKLNGSTEAPQYKFGETKKTFYVDGLEAGKYYTFQVSANNAAGESGWSAEQAFLVR